jgi:hypothetical protein
LFDQEQRVCRLAAEMVRATRALAQAEGGRAATAYCAAVVERSLVSLVEEVYAVEFDLALGSNDRLRRERGVTPTEQKIHALAADFISSLADNAGDSMQADDSPLAASMLLGGKFDALSAALRQAGYQVG